MQNNKHGLSLHFILVAIIATFCQNVYKLQLAAYSIAKELGRPCCKTQEISIKLKINSYDLSETLWPSYTEVRSPIGHFTRCFDRLSCVILVLVFCVTGYRR